MSNGFLFFAVFLQIFLQVSIKSEAMILLQFLHWTSYGLGVNLEVLEFNFVADLLAIDLHVVNILGATLKTYGFLYTSCFPLPSIFFKFEDGISL